MKFCVLGLGRFGYHVATRLAENGMEVLGVDNNESIVASVRDSITQAICIQVHDEASLRSIGVDEMDTVIVAMGENFAASILITALLKKRLNVPLVITRAVNEIHKEILLLIGADQIILPEKEIGNSLADNLSLPFRVITRITKQFSISQINAPQRFLGKTIKKIGLLENYHLNCIGIKKDGDIITLDKDYIVQENDTLVLAGLNKDLAGFAKL
jgi:trk system potassium uptake protein TrkA